MQQKVQADFIALRLVLVDGKVCLYVFVCVCVCVCVCYCVMVESVSCG